MSMCSDGVSKKEFHRTNGLLASETPSSNSEDLLEEVFRGFEKTPKVLIERFDITPFFTNYNAGSNVNYVVQRLDKSKDIKFHHFHLSRKCTVNLRRENLENLKQSFKKIAGNSRRSSRESISSSNTASMSNIYCKICGKRYSSEKKLQKHQENKHMIIYKPVTEKVQKRVSFSNHIIVHEMTEYHKCRKCSKAFINYKFLKVHMRKSHKKRKRYECDYCKKKFADRMFFKAHIKLHCDVCRLLLPNKAKYMEHRRNICRILKHHSCKNCNMTFFKVMDLKDHSYEHSNIQFVCDICKDHFDTKCAIAHHLLFLHSEKQPTSLYTKQKVGNETLYLCNFCNDSTVELDLIKAHVCTLPDLMNRVMTGYKDYYFCDQCFNKFGTEKDMVQHKWSHFLKNSDNSQLRDNDILHSLLANPLIEQKTTYKLSEKLPPLMQPRLVLEKLQIKRPLLTDSANSVKCNTITETVNSIDTESQNICTTNVEKPIVKSKPRKTLVSKYQCQNCYKYYSSNYCLNRHIETQHLNYEDLQCKVCEETFVWPSLLKAHKCIRLNLPEMPFEDARPEIHFDNLHDIYQNDFDNLDIMENNDYINAVDFDIPAPIVELTEYDSAISTTNMRNEQNIMDCDKTLAAPLQNLGYKLVLQEVPIEF